MFRKSLFLFLLLFSFSLTIKAQELQTSDPLINQAFKLALWTLDTNTHDGIIHAGAGYGGEWTRDCAINCWNAASLLNPTAAEKSLWSVTNDSITIGHQYWDKILWVMAAYNHWLITGDKPFLRKAYLCAKKTMAELEDSCFDSQYGLFMGPAVFQDGIAGYDEPVYNPAKWDDSYVLHHPHSRTIKCLSTNVAYYQAYRTLELMRNQLSQKPDKVSRADSVHFCKSADNLKQSIRAHLYRPEQNTLYYLIDHLGHPHDYQEGLGLGLALMTDIFSSEEAARLVSMAHISDFGIPCVYPSFPRNTPDKPGRHNMMIWPHVNMFFAQGCATQGLWEPFYFEMHNLAHLAINRGNGNFYEIYTLEGDPSGGYQCGALWDKKPHQTWCATGFLGLFLRQVFGLRPAPEGLYFAPHGMDSGDPCTLSGIPYRKAILNITVVGHGSHLDVVRINGEETRPFIPSDAQGEYNIELFLSD